MNEDIHNEDEPFQKAYGRMEEDPSPEIWEKINARLDSQDVVYYRKRFVTWKRIACLLLLLLSTTVLYQLYTSKDKTATLVDNQPKTASDSRKAEPVKENVSGNGAAQQPVGKSVDTVNTLHNDQSDRMAAGEMHHSYYNRQPLPAQAAAEDANDFSLVHSQAPGDSSYRKSPVTDSSDSQLSLQKNGNHFSFGSILNQKLQATDSLRMDSDSQNKNDIVNDIDDKTLEKDSALIAAITDDFISDKKNGISASANNTIRLHKPSAGAWSVTPFISADVTGYELDDDHERGSGNQQPEPHRQEIKQRETHQFSFSAGAFAKWQFSSRVSLKTGLVYSNIAIGIQPQTLYALQDNNQSISYKFITSSGYAYVKPVFSSTPETGDSITAEISHHHLQFLSVPLTIGYKFSANKRLTVTPGVGLSANLLLSTRIKTEINEDTDKEMIVINKLQGLRKTYFSFMADADINYFLSKRFSLSLLPVFKYAINPITKDNVVNTFPYSLSIGAGVTYSF